MRSPCLGLAALFFGEAIGPLTGLGAALTIGGIGAAVGGPAGARWRRPADE